jgi:NhaP-type Na+/H+ or K+/H+ antiporter
MYENMAIIGVFIFIYSIVCGRLERTPVNGAIVFTAFGLVFGPLGFGLLKLSIDSETLKVLAELTLALVLFSEAANSNLGVLKRSFRLPQRLLLIGLPLTILLGFGVGILLFGELSLLEIAILATLLAPTDAALGKAVVSNKSVPAEIREGLNVESGINDGICVPVLFILLALVSTSGGETNALALVVEELGIGIAVGASLAAFGAWIIKICGNRGWITDSWRQLIVVSLAVACFASAQSLGGSGFIAAFVGGLLFGGLAKHSEYKHPLLLAAEGTADTFALITWVVFGAIAVGYRFTDLSWQVVLYAVLSLTLIRMLPVFLSLLGMRLSIHEKLFIGWFGPRGLASIVFGVIVLHEHLPGGDTIIITVISTIVLSVVAHGLSANPLVAALTATRKHAESHAAAGEAE